jgi:hypothetical protein
MNKKDKYYQIQLHRLRMKIRFFCFRNWLLLRKMWEERRGRKYTGFTTCDALPYTVLSPKATEGINVSSGLVFARGVLKATSETHTLWAASAKTLASCKVSVKR